MKYARFRDPSGAIRRGTWAGDSEVRFGGQRYARTEVDLLPPSDPSKIVCVGLNYAGHAAEMEKEVPEDAYVRASVNGQRRQDGSLDGLIFSVPELIAEITTYITLEAGDVIATGTPKGVGPVENGDDVEIEIEGIGTLEHSVRIPDGS